MTYCVYITALQYGCEHVDAENEEDAKKEVEKLYDQNRISWHDGEITDVSVEDV